MHDNWLIAIALSTTALGIIGLQFALIMMDPDEVKISFAKNSPENTPLNVRGDVENIQRRGNITIVQVSQPESLDIVLFQEINLTKGDCVIVRGRKSSYEGQPQLVATRMELCG